MRCLPTFLAPVLGALFSFSGLAHASSGWHGHLAVEGYGSLLSGSESSPLLGLNAGWAVRAGASSGRWGAFLHVEQNLWRGTEYGATTVPGALNVGLGAELRFADGRIRSSATLGPSLLLFDTPLDEAGKVGVFAELRPLGLRWAVSRHLQLGLDPLSFAVAAPVLSGIPLVRVQYRTTLSLEVLLP
ncbi:hypothetical protein KYC5002_10695 [Archangium violaceum]|uniref:hypothetical protein n=1 Tax=Archangium violaceum TaxID=83451 RepID=UPI002B2F58FC|nr:hypothetical protein KYC5002_10695 [Archangium gephyra]